MTPDYWLFHAGEQAGFWNGFAAGMIAMFCLSVLFWLVFLVPDKPGRKKSC